MINWADFHFLRPLWLLLIPLALVVLFSPLSKARQKTSWDRVIDPHLLPHLFRERTNKQSSRGGSWWLFSFFLLIALSLSGPTLKKIPNDTAFFQAPLVICLELSPHMLAKDLDPSRLKRALFKLEDLLRSYTGAEVGLIAFAGDAHVVVPLSNDYNTVLTMAKTLTPDLMPVKGVNLKRAVLLARDMTKKYPRSQIVVMSSSNFDDTSLDLPPLPWPAVVWAFATEPGGPMEMADGRFDQNRGGGITISKLRRDYLAKLDTAGNAKTLLFSADMRDVETIVRGLGADAPVLASHDVLFDQWYDLGPYVLAFAMAAFLGSLWFGREQLMVALLVAVVPAHDGHAGVADWFLRRDQQGQRALDANEPAKAAELFEDAFQKGNAYYRAKNYDEAIKHLSSVNTSDGQYNLGNAFAQKGQYQEAIAAYDNALKLDPKNADAQANKELLENNQQQQQQKDQPGDGEKNQQQQENKQSDEKSEQQEGQEKKQASDSKNKNEPKPSQEEQEQQQKKQQQSSDGNGGNPEQKQGLQTQKGHKEKDTPLEDKLDPETRYHLQRLEQNNSLYLKRKFYYESQKRQGE